jgi:hypothetical protein
VIVRMHHSAHQDHLVDLFEGYGRRPGWNERQTEMIQTLRAVDSLHGGSRVARRGGRMAATNPSDTVVARVTSIG